MFFKAKLILKNFNDKSMRNLPWNKNVKVSFFKANSYIAKKNQIFKDDCLEKIQYRNKTIDNCILFKI